MKTIKIFALIHVIVLLLLATNKLSASEIMTPNDFFNLLKQNDTAIVKQTIRDGFEINKSYGKRGDEKTPLIEAIKQSRVNIVKALLDYGANVNIRTPDDTPPLHIAITWAAMPDSDKFTPDRRLDAIRIFDLLIERNADVNYQNMFGATPLGFAVLGVHYESSLYMTKKLLKAGAEINPTYNIDTQGMPPIFWALGAIIADWGKDKENRIEMLELLLDSGAEVNVRLQDGTTPLHLASVNYDITKLFLDAGADKHAKDNAGKTPFDTALAANNFKAVLLLATY